MPYPINPPRRLLLVRNDRVGDLVLTLPSIEAIRSHWPKVQLTVLASKIAAPLLQNYAAIDEVIIDDASQNAWQLSQQLRPRKFDAAIVANSSWRSFLAVTLAGIPHRVGWGRKLPGMLFANYRLMVSRSRPPVHEADFTAKMVNLLHPTGSATDYPVHLPIDAGITSSVRNRIEQQVGNKGPLFVFNLSNFRGAYNWPVEQFAKLAIELAPHGRVIGMTGPTEKTIAENFLALIPDRLKSKVAAISDFDLRQLAAAFRVADVVTSANTGPMHIAGALNCPLVALFSSLPAQAPAKWRPLGTRQTLLVAPLLPGENHKMSPAQVAEHMSRISVEDVVTANLNWLQQRQRLSA